MADTTMGRGISSYITSRSGGHYAHERPIFLSNVPLYTETVLSGMKLNGLLSQKLLDLGFTPHTRIEVIRRGPYDNLIAVRVRGSVIAIRKSEADAMLVELYDSSGVSRLSADIQEPRFMNSH